MSALLGFLLLQWCLRLSLSPQGTMGQPHNNNNNNNNNNILRPIYVFAQQSPKHAPSKKQPRPSAGSPKSTPTPSAAAPEETPSPSSTTKRPKSTMSPAPITDAPSVKMAQPGTTPPGTLTPTNTVQPTTGPPSLLAPSSSSVTPYYLSQFPTTSPVISSASTVPTVGTFLPSSNHFTFRPSSYLGFHPTTIRPITATESPTAVVPSPPQRSVVPFATFTPPNTVSHVSPSPSSPPAGAGAPSNVAPFPQPVVTNTPSKIVIPTDFPPTSPPLITTNSTPPSEALVYSASYRGIQMTLYGLSSFSQDAQRTWINVTEFYIVNYFEKHPEFQVIVMDLILTIEQTSLSAERRRCANSMTWSSQQQQQQQQQQQHYWLPLSSGRTLLSSSSPPPSVVVTYNQTFTVHTTDSATSTSITANTFDVIVSQPFLDTDSTNLYRNLLRKAGPAGAFSNLVGISNVTFPRTGNNSNRTFSSPGTSSHDGDNSSSHGAGNGNSLVNGSSQSNQGLSMASIIAISVASVIVVGLALLVALYYLSSRRRRRRAYYDRAQQGRSSSMVVVGKVVNDKKLTTSNSIPSAIDVKDGELCLEDLSAMLDPTATPTAAQVGRRRLTTTTDASSGGWNKDGILHEDQSATTELYDHSKAFGNKDDDRSILS